MTAFGGKREKGVRKEKKLCMPVFGVVVEELTIVCGCWEDLKDKTVRKTAVAAKAVIMTILGGRMMMSLSWSCRTRHLASSSAAMKRKGSHPPS